MIGIRSDLDRIKTAALFRAFKAINPDLGKRIERKVLRKRTKPLLEAVQAAIPIGPARTVYRNGLVFEVSGGQALMSARLRKMNKMAPSNFGVVVSVGRRKPRGTDPQDPFYVTFLERGTVNMTARPIMRPAVESNRSTILTKVPQDIRDEMVKSAKKAIPKSLRKKIGLK